MKDGSRSTSASMAASAAAAAAAAMVAARAAAVGLLLAGSRCSAADRIVLARVIRLRLRGSRAAARPGRTAPRRGPACPAGCRRRRRRSSSRMSRVLARRGRIAGCSAGTVPARRRSGGNNARRAGSSSPPRSDRRRSARHARAAGIFRRCETDAADLHVAGHSTRTPASWDFGSYIASTHPLL